MMIVLAAVLLGAAGSAHCAAMCGPLVLLTHRPDASTPGMRHRLGLTRLLALHHGARIFVYLSLGLLAGTLGAAASGFGWQRAMAVAAGVTLVLQAAGLAARWSGGRQPRWIRSTVLRLSGVARALPAGHAGRPLLLGAVNGMMPCGLLYAALAAAAGVGHIGAALIFMAAFGVGTLPVFSVLIFSAHTLAPRLPRAFRQAAPIALALLGVLLIARGLPGSIAHAAGAHAMHGH